MVHKSFKEIFIESEESRILKEKREILKEMIVYGNKDSDKYIVAFNKWIFLFDKAEAIESFRLIIEKLKEVFPKNSFINEIGLIHDRKYYSEHIEELLEELHNEVKDTLVGVVKKDTLYVHQFVTMDFNHSILFKKVFRQLSLSKYGMIGLNDYKEMSTTDIESFPDIGFHGSSSTKLVSIIKNGLIAGNLINWSNLKHIDGRGLVFFVTNSITPLFNTKNATTMNGGIPIIIEFEIPDKSKIIQDYDVEMFSGVIKHYDRKDMFFKKAISNKPLSLSKELGIYAYRGSILPQKIKAIWCPEENKEEYVLSDFVRMSIKDAVKKLGVFIL